MIPQELIDLGVSYIKQVGRNEFCSTCPKCGGSPHGSARPDRFRFWPVSRRTGGPMGWCRRCGYVWTPKKEIIRPMPPPAPEIDPHILAVERLRESRVWERYHEALTGEVRQLYHARLIDDYWIEYWMLGQAERRVFDGEEEYISTSMTIPVFLPNADPVTIRHRLLAPRNPNDRYRPEFSGLPAALFYCDRDKPPAGKALIVEGEFKAMTTMITLDDPDMFVFGVPGKTPPAELFDALKNCEVIYAIFDPDADDKDKGGHSAIDRLQIILKERLRVIRLPWKVDDMIVKGWLDKTTLRSLIANARRI